MKKTNKKYTSLSGFCLIMLTVLTGIGAAHAQTVTHKREIKLPGRLLNVVNLALNDSGLGATDLDQTQQVTWKQRFLVMQNRLYAMHERADGTAYYGTVRQSDVESHLTSVVERHINTNGSYPTEATLFGMMGTSNRYNLINHQGQTQTRWTTGAPSSRAIVFGGAGTSILGTAASYLLNGVETRLISINHNNQLMTSFSGDVVGQTGKSIGGLMAMAYGADDLLYLLDYENLRILKFDTGVRGGTRGAFLGAFDLDPTKPAIKSMTVDSAGNVYVGSDNGGFHIYGSDGQWKQSIVGIYQTDPNADANLPNDHLPGYFAYMNYYASGLNDGNGTLDVRDATGYRQYTITAPGQTPPIQITAEPQSQAICLLSPTNLSVVAAADDGASLTYEWRKNGVAITDGGTISGATTANLSISSTVSGDAGYYDVLVRKSGAIVTSQASIITVTPTPIITQQPADQSLQIGDGATFTATADHAAGVQWQVSTDGGTIFTDISGATNAAFSIPSVDNSHVGNYYRAVFAGLCGAPVISRAAALKLSQTITFANPGAKTFGDPAFDLGGTASSGLAVSYTVVFGPATVTGSILTLTNSGIVSIKASQSGNDDYAAAPDVIQTFTVMRPGNPAAPYTVDTISDDVSLSACTSAPNDCSLRAAVFVANSSASDDTINFDSSLAGQTILLDSATTSFAGQLNIADNGSLTINGLGSNQLTISGNNASRVFFIEANAVAAVNGLTVTGGFGSGYDNGNGGGIYNLTGALTLTNVAVSNNSAPNGGGIYSNGGALTLDSSIVSGNSTGGGRGGGIYQFDGTLTLTGSTVSDNSTINGSGNGAGSGGGIFVWNNGTTLTDSTVSGNRAQGATSGGGGGGMFVNHGTTTLTDSTFSGNRAGGGGGVYIADFSSGTTTLINTTVTENLNKVGIGEFVNGGGVYNAGTSTVTVSNSIIAKNGGGTLDVTGPFVSGGYNLIGYIFTSGVNRATGFGATGDKFVTNGARLDAQLLPLGFYGGATKTHALAAGSPAIDAGNGTLTTDQRGFSRPVDSPSIANAADGNGADIGAFEVQFSPESAQGIEGDVAARPNGDGSVNSGDVTQIRRFVLGLDTPTTTPNEFQRADVAPYETKGDGVLNAGDVTQIRRYALAQDPPADASGPTDPNASRPESIDETGKPAADDGRENFSKQSKGIKRLASQTTRTLSVVRTNMVGTTLTIALQLNTDASETGASAFNADLNFDPSILSNPTNVRTASGLAGTNGIGTNGARSSALGNAITPDSFRILTDLPLQTFGLGVQNVVLIDFTVAAGATGTTPISLSNVFVSDVNGNSLSVRTLPNNILTEYKQRRSGSRVLSLNDNLAPIDFIAADLLNFNVY